MIFEKFKLYLIIGGITLLLGVLTNAYTAYKFYGYGQENVQAKWDKAKAANVNDKVNTKVKQDAVQNAPVDNAVTVRRLRGGTF